MIVVTVGYCTVRVGGQLTMFRALSVRVSLFRSNDGAQPSEPVRSRVQADPVSPASPDTARRKARRSRTRKSLAVVPVGPRAAAEPNVSESRSKAVTELVGNMTVNMAEMRHLLAGTHVLPPVPRRHVYFRTDSHYATMPPPCICAVISGSAVRAQTRSGCMSRSSRARSSFRSPSAIRGRQVRRSSSSMKRWRATLSC